MIVTHKIGILGAQLKLTALSSLQGKVIRDALEWQLVQVADDSKSPKTYSSFEAQALFNVTVGDYTIYALYRGEQIDLGGVYLEQNSCTDAVFILQNDFHGTEDDYFADYDAMDDFQRRKQEREAQSEYGLATLPLREPDPEMPVGELGSQVMAHPLLQNSAQFDGVPPDMRPDPSENEAALQLTLAQKLTATPSADATPTPSPTR